eukprot:2852239-Amphidinium_carterae.1
MDGDDVDTLNLAPDAIDEAHKDVLPIFVWGNIPYRDSGNVRSINFYVLIMGTYNKLLHKRWNTTRVVLHWSGQTHVKH